MRILCQLLKDFGPTLLEDPTRLDALLADLWGQYRCERFLLFHAAKLVSKSRDRAGYGHQIPQDLQKNYGFSSEAAQWATESWFAALDLSPPQPNTSRNGSHTGLSNGPQLALRRLLTDYGPALLEDPACACPPGRSQRVELQGTIPFGPGVASAYTGRTIGPSHGQHRPDATAFPPLSDEIWLLG